MSENKSMVNCQQFNILMLRSPPKNILLWVNRQNTEKHCFIPSKMMKT